MKVHALLAVLIQSLLVRSYKMPTIKNYQNSQGIECIQIINEDDTTESMLKSTYDEMIAKQDEASTL